MEAKEEEEERISRLVVGGDLLECGADVIVQQYSATRSDPTRLSTAIARKWPYAAPALASPAQPHQQGATARVGDVYLSLPSDTTLGEMKVRIQKRHEAESAAAAATDAAEWQPIVARVVGSASGAAAAATATDGRCAAFARALRTLRAQLVRIGAHTVAFPYRIGCGRSSATETDDCWRAYCELLLEFSSDAPFRVLLVRRVAEPAVGDAVASDTGTSGDEVQIVANVAAPDFRFPPRPPGGDDDDDSSGGVSGRGGARPATKKAGKRENGWLWSDVDDEWLCRCCAQLVATVSAISHRGSDDTRVWRALATVGLFRRDPVGDPAVLRHLNRGVAEIARLARRPVGPVEARLALYARGATRHDGGGDGVGVRRSDVDPAPPRQPHATKKKAPGSRLAQLFGAAVSAEAVAARHARQDRKWAAARHAAPRPVDPAAVAAADERAPTFPARTPAAAASPLLVSSGERQPSFAETWLAKYRAPKPRTNSVATATTTTRDGCEPKRAVAPPPVAEPAPPRAPTFDTVEQEAIARCGRDQARLTASQRRVCDLVLASDGGGGGGARPNAFVAGGARTGKSFLLRHVARCLRFRHKRRVAVVATRAALAFRARGVTIRQFFGLSPADECRTLLPTLVARLKASPVYAARWTESDVVAIADGDGVHAWLLDRLDAVARQMRVGRSHLPFGGWQVLVFGDLHLPDPTPPAGKLVRHCFEALAWKSVAAHSFVLEALPPPPTAVDSFSRDAGGDGGGNGDDDEKSVASSRPSSPPSTAAAATENSDLDALVGELRHAENFSTPTLAALARCRRRWFDRVHGVGASGCDYADGGDGGGGADEKSEHEARERLAKSRVDPIVVMCGAHERRRADVENERRLALLASDQETVEFVAVDSGHHQRFLGDDDDSDAAPVARRVRLRVGAQVMLLEHNSDAEADATVRTDGAGRRRHRCGIVVGWHSAPPVASACAVTAVARSKTAAASRRAPVTCADERLPIVALESGVSAIVRRRVFEIVLEESTVASRRQLPLALAWSLSTSQIRTLRPTSTIAVAFCATAPSATGRGYGDDGDSGAQTTLCLDRHPAPRAGELYAVISRLTTLADLHVIAHEPRVGARRDKLVEFERRALRAEEPAIAATVSAKSADHHGVADLSPPAADPELIAVGRQQQRRRTTPAQPPRRRSAPSATDPLPPPPPPPPVEAEKRASMLSAPPPPPPPPLMATTVVLRRAKRKSAGHATPTGPDVDGRHKKQRRRRAPAPPLQVEDVADDGGMRDMCETDGDREAAATAAAATSLPGLLSSSPSSSSSSALTEPRLEFSGSAVCSAAVVAVGPTKSFRKFSRGAGGAASLSATGVRAARPKGKCGSAGQKVTPPTDTPFAPDCGWIARKPRRPSPSPVAKSD